MGKPAGGGAGKGVSPVIVVVVIVVVLLVLAAVWFKMSAGPRSTAEGGRGNLMGAEKKLEMPKAPLTAEQKAAAEKVQKGLEKAGEPGAPTKSPP